MNYSTGPQLYPNGFVPNRQVVVDWSGDRDSLEYTLKNRGPMDVDRFVDYWTDKHPNNHEPVVAGAAGYSQAPPFYGTSGPQHRGRETWIADTNNVYQNRINAVDPQYYTNLSGTNKIGACCEWVTMPGQFTQFAGTLRVLVSEARKAAALNPGLRIVDNANGRVYQSTLTVQCFQAQEIGSMSKAEIQNVLRGEMARLGQSAH
ncbi:hypothetical protein B0H11DRAFT_2282310 [Mycena galericulata]|nr:hypothetical protein B0H11DRAFT_2282310 [Mycena galericulata]